MALGIVLLLILSVGVIALEGDSAGTTDYSEMNEQEQINYLQENHGITIGGAGLSGVIVSGDSVSISDGSFDFKGATFSGGSVEIVGNEIVSADGVLINDYNHNGAKVFGTVTIGSGFIHLDEGSLNLGSSTDSGMEISASAGTNIDVSGGKGYSGNIIANDGKFDLKLRDSSSFKEQHLGVGLDIELVNGRIKKGEDLEALILLEDALDAAPGETASFAPGTKIENGEIESEMACVGKSCSDSSGSGKKHTIKVIPVEGRKGNAKLEYNGENIKHSEIVEVQNDEVGVKQAVVVKRELVQTDGSIYDPETNAWELAAGTRVKELKPFGELVDFSVSKKTDYFPEAASRSICDKSPNSCFVYDKWNSMRIKSKDGNEINVETKQTIPHLIVDKIDGDGEVKLKKSDYKGNQVDLLFTKDQALVSPPSEIEKLDMQIAFDYETVDGETRAMKLNPLENNVKINGKTIALFDEEVAKNYYQTRFGAIISNEFKERNTARIQKIKSIYPNFDSTDPQIMDLILTAAAAGVKDFDRIDDIVDTYDSYIKYLPINIDRDLVLRTLLTDESSSDSDIETLTSLSDQIENAISVSPLLNTKLMGKYDNGEFSSLEAITISSELKLEFENPDDANRYIDLVSGFKSNSEDENDIIKIVRKAEDYAALSKLGIVKTGLTTIDLLEKVFNPEGAPMGVSLPEEIKMTEEEFFDGLYALKLFKLTNDNGYSTKSTEMGYDIIKNLPELVKKINNLEKKADHSTSYDYLRRLLEDPKTRKETVDLFNELAKKLEDPTLDEELKSSLKESFQELSIRQLGPALNEISHDKGGIKGMIKTVDIKAILSVLAQQPDGNVGQPHGIFRANLVTIEKEILLRAKKEGKSFFEYIVSNTDSKKQRDQTFRMLAATGIGQTHLAEASPEIIEEYSKYVVEDIILEPNGAGSFVAASETLLGNKATNLKYQQILLKEYVRLSQTNQKVDFNGDGIVDERDEKFRTEKKVILEALVLKNKNNMDQTNPQTLAIMTNPDPKAVGVVKSFKIPSGIYKKWPKTEDGTPIRYTIYSHGSTDEFPTERRYFNQVKDDYKRAKIIKTMKNEDGRVVGYELERDNVHFDGNDGKIKVKDRIIIYAAAEYSGYQEEMERYTEMSRNGQIFMKVYGGHMGGKGTKETLQGEPTVLYYNGCYGKSGVEDAVRNGDIGPDTKAAFGTSGTASRKASEINRRIMDEMFQKTDDLVAIDKKMREERKKNKVQDNEQYGSLYEIQISKLMSESGTQIEYRDHQYNEPENNVADTEPKTVPPADLDELEDKIAGILTG